MSFQLKMRLQHCFIVLMLCVVTISAQTCENWVSISETNYYRTYVSMTSVDANKLRPLGYKVASYTFEGTRPCFLVAPTGGNDRHIEIKWEMENPGTLCVQVKGGGNRGCTKSATGNICDTVPDGKTSVTYEFFCSGSGCEGGVKMFWYRFVVETPLEDGSFDENWCQNRPSDYPKTLIAVPGNATPVPQKPTTCAAHHVISSYVITIIAALGVGLIPAVANA